jgi:hypothetical protein
MNDNGYQELVDTVLARELTPAEQERLRLYLEAYPEARVDWEAELSLTHALRGLPDAPLSTNFTAQVLAAAQRSARRAYRKRSGSWWDWLASYGHAWQAALATAALAVALLAQYQYRLHTQTELAHGAAHFSAFATLLMPDMAAARGDGHPSRAEAATGTTPTVEMLQDFDQINRLPLAPIASEDELLAALQ